MVDENRTYASPGGDAQAAKGRLEQEKDSANRVVSDAAGAIKKEAQSMAEGARDEAYARGEQIKGQAADNLHTFADAVRKARDELDKDGSPVSGFVGQAADGLERLSRSVQNTSGAEMLDSVREFGRRNPMSFIAASVLAGIALGRFAQSSSRHAERRASENTPARAYPTPTPSKPSTPPRAYPAGEGSVTPSRTTGGPL
ncbi:hypothetical protein [Aquibium oceanicum]|uniref:Nutrient deprivation-induced protein n=1 Tax=Aquibium oceanicum TaxID=1670800 RepID=A0A1L3SM48_9HYPH|nr:hypothetical protein [Aquibium oceanicum]APH70415.1 hypothetical protein BSQ44_02740 [Aquibium oceanicum]